MNKCKKYMHYIVIMLLIVIIAVSSFLLLNENLKQKKQVKEFEELKKIIEVAETENNKEENNKIIETIEQIEETKEEINVFNYINLQELYNINSDLVGWIKIDGTNISYPVMQNGNFYLRKNFYKNYSSSGTPYLAEYCSLKTSDNLILYGHNMNNKTMFSNLENYKTYNFYKNHKFIKFYTLESGKTIENIYEIIFAFKTVAYSDSGFKYNNFYLANSEEQYNEFILKCKEVAFYDTGETAKYGDKLITLSTCEYSQKNGRMVVVGRKI